MQQAGCGEGQYYIESVEQKAGDEIREVVESGKRSITEEFRKALTVNQKN